MIRILAVCGMGLGSSFAIEMVLEEVLKELNVQADLGHTSVSDVSSLKADIIVTSTNFAATLNVTSSGTPIVALQKLTDKDEIKSKIEPILKELGYL
ncbi:MAG: PTS sugar transporter subunit IIB [Brevinema sp.]